MASFSQRNRYADVAKAITIREDAPEGLRVTVLEIAHYLRMNPVQLHRIVCETLRERFDPGNWSEYPNVWDEIQAHLHDCEWFKVYDIIEAIHAYFQEKDSLNPAKFTAYLLSVENIGWKTDATRFANEINAYFVKEGIGWQLVKGQIVMRGTEAFESIVPAAVAALDDTARPTAARHLHEALADLSRRPTADLTGAISHAMGALEAVARDRTGDPKATLGEVVQRNPDLLPKPIGSALSKLWGYASNEARHVREGHEPNREEAELLVGLAAVMATYLTRK